MALSSRLAVSGQISVIIWPNIWYYPAGYPVLSGRISGIIWPDIRYYLAGYPVLSGRISGIIWPDIRYYLAGYPVLSGRISGKAISRISGHISESGSKKLQDIPFPAIRFCFNQQDIRLSGKITIRYIPNFNIIDSCSNSNNLRIHIRVIVYS